MQKFYLSQMFKEDPAVLPAYAAPPAILHRGGAGVHRMYLPLIVIVCSWLIRGNDIFLVFFGIINTIERKGR